MDEARNLRSLGFPYPTAVGLSADCRTHRLPGGGCSVRVLMSWRDADDVGHPAEDSLRVEMRLREVARGLAVTVVVASDPLHPLDGFHHRPEREQPLADRIGTTESRVLDEYRLPQREVMRRSIAEPATPSFDVDTLGHGEFRVRILKKTMESVRIGDDRLRVLDPPSMALECLSIRAVGRVDVQGDLKRLRYLLGQSDELAKFVGLLSKESIVVGYAAVRAAPACHGRESVKVSSWLGSAAVEHYRRTRRMPGDADGGDRAIRAADVLPHGEIPVMSSEAGTVVP